MWEWVVCNADTIGNLGPLVAAASSVIAAIGAFYVYLQFKRAKSWRKGDLAAAMMEKLDSDEDLAFACQALDWGVGPIIVPERFRPLMRRLQPGDEAVLDHFPSTLASALEPGLNEATQKSAAGLIYRHCFVKLFNHIENLGRLVASDQVAAEEIQGLTFWLEQIASYGYVLEQPDHVFQPALAAWGYHKIPELGRKLRVTNWSVYDAECNRY